MSAVFVLQTGLLAFVTWRTVQQIRWVSGSARADARLAQALTELVLRGDSDVVRRWVLRGHDGWVAQVVAVALNGGDRGDRARDCVDYFHRLVRERMYVVNGMARMTSVCTLLSIVLELSWGLSGGSGIEALQAGLPQQIAFRNVLVSLSLGFVTLGVYMRGRTQLHRATSRAMKALRAMALSLADTGQDSA